MSKDSRSGKKYGGSHTSLIPAATLVCDLVHKIPSVTKISPGFIKAGLRSVNGQRRVKITCDKTHILLSIRDNASHQEVRVYANDVEATADLIATEVKKIGLAVTRTH